MGALTQGTHLWWLAAAAAALLHYRYWDVQLEIITLPRIEIFVPLANRHESSVHPIHVVRAAALAERSGAEIVQAHCAQCHENGYAGAPEIGDRRVWLYRLRLGMDLAVLSMTRGRCEMPPHSVSPGLTHIELRRAVLFMANPRPVSAPFEKRDRLDVRGVREHVDHAGGREPEPLGMDEDAGIPGERRRVT